MKKIIHILFFQFILCFSMLGQQAEISLPMDEYLNVQVRTNDILQFNVDSYSVDKFLGSILIEMSDESGATQSVMRTGELSVFPGLNSAEQLLSQSALISQFASTSFFASSNKQFVFPRGRYRVCITLLNKENGQIDQKCLIVETLDANELLLIYPYDEDAIVELNPVFTWTPIIQNNLTYRVKWVESDQAKIDDNSFLQSLPFYTIDNLRNNVFPYANRARKMSMDKYYFWRVEAYMDGRLLAESDIWQFHFDNPEKALGSNPWFVDVDAVRSGDIISFRGDQIGFQIENYSSNQPIQFELIDGVGNVLMTDQDIPINDMKVGKNYFTLDPPIQLIEDSPYQLKIQSRQKKYSITLLKVEQ